MVGDNNPKIGQASKNIFRVCYQTLSKPDEVDWNEKASSTTGPNIEGG